jgi:hypothetical protein
LADGTGTGRIDTDNVPYQGHSVTKQRFENDRTGYRVVVAMSSGTGERGDYVVVDPYAIDLG